MCTRKGCHRPGFQYELQEDDSLALICEYHFNKKAHIRSAAAPKEGECPRCKAGEPNHLYPIGGGEPRLICSRCWAQVTGRPYASTRPKVIATKGKGQ